MAGAQEKKEFVLFFSPECKFSKNFISKLKSKPELFKKFNLVNIDTISDIPDEVDEIPCVYDGKKVHKGEEAFKWLEEKSIEFLEPANDSLRYSFINGEDEQIFNNFSLLDQKNGSFGITAENTSDNNKITKSANMSLESLMSSRSSDMQNIK